MVKERGALEAEIVRKCLAHTDQQGWLALENAVRIGPVLCFGKAFSSVLGTYLSELTFLYTLVDRIVYNSCVYFKRKYYEILSVALKMSAHRKRHVDRANSANCSSSTGSEMQLDTAENSVIDVNVNNPRKKPKLSSRALMIAENSGLEQNDAVFTCSLIGQVSNSQHRDMCSSSAGSIRGQASYQRQLKASPTGVIQGFSNLAPQLQQLQRT